MKIDSSSWSVNCSLLMLVVIGLNAILSNPTNVAADDPDPGSLCTCLGALPAWEPPIGYFSNEPPCADVDENLLLQSDILCYTFVIPSDKDTFICADGTTPEVEDGICIDSDYFGVFNDIHFNHYEDSPNFPPPGHWRASLTDCPSGGRDFDIQLVLAGFEPGTHIISYYFADKNYGWYLDPDPENPPPEPLSPCTDGGFIGTVSFYVQDPESYGEISFDDPLLDADGTDVTGAGAPPPLAPNWYLEGAAYDTYIDPSNGTIYAGTEATRVVVGATPTGPPGSGAPPERPLQIGGGCGDGDCNSGACVAGNENVELGSVDVTIGLGSFDRQHSAGYLWMHADTPSQFLGTPAGWNIQPPKGVSIDGNGPTDPWQCFRKLGIPQAIIAPETIVVFDWQETEDTSSTTHLDFFHRSDLDPNGENPYDVLPGATPYLRWVVNATGDGQGPSTLSLTKILDPVGTPTNSVVSYAYSSPNGGTVQLVRDLGDGQEVTEIETLSYNSDGRLAVRDVIIMPSEGMGRHYVDSYSATPIGNLVTLRQDYVSDNPLVTRDTNFEYYDASNTSPQLSHLHGHLRSIQYPDGSWEWRNYDTSHRLIEIRRPLGSYTLPSGVDPDPTFCIRTVNAYDSALQATGFERHPTLVLEYEGSGDINNPGSIVVGRRFMRYEDSPEEYIKTTVSQCLSDNALETDPDNLVTRTWYRDFQEKLPRAIIYPDGRMTAFIAEPGAYIDVGTPESATFTPGGGSFERVTVYNGYAPLGGGLTPDFVAMKSTKTTTVTDAMNNVVLTETYVYTGDPAPDDFARVEYAVNELDEYGHRTRTDQSNGMYETWEWGCCTLDRHVSVEGIIMDFTDHDGEGRVKQWVQRGFNGTVDVTETVVRDGLGGILSRTTQGGAISQTTTRQFDQLGRLDSEFDIANVETDYEYEDLPGGGRRVTVNLPGNLDRVTEYALDGRMTSITGSAVVSQFLEYGVDESGRPYTKVTSGDEQTGPYSIIFFDLLSRPVEEIRPGIGSTLLRERSVYEGSQLVQRTWETIEDDGQGGQTTTIKSSACYEYDKLGNRTTTCDDLNFDGNIDLTGPDRVTLFDSSFLQDGAMNWWSVTTRSILPDNGSSVSVVVDQTKTMLTGFEPGVSSFSKSYDIFGNESFFYTYIDRANRRATQTATSPESTQPQEQIIENGRLISSTSSTDITTTFDYDDIGRRISVTAPRTGVYTTHYDTNGRVDYVEDPLLNRTTFEYDEWGRRAVVLNHESKATRYAFDEHGQINRVWGDVPQPVELEFDPIYRRRTAMKTFRDPTVDWTQPEWPLATGDADITYWDYDEATGVLLSKTDAAPQLTSYQYHADLTLKRRTWARTPGGNPLYAEYVYFPTGELQTVDYSDSTPDVGFSYDRLGRLKEVTDATGTRVFAYNNHLQLESETVTGSLYNKVITRSYEASATPLGRYTGVSVGPDAQHPNDDYLSTIGYGPFGRVNAITGPGLENGTAEYQYLDDSNLIEELRYLNSAQAIVARSARTYEPKRDLLTSINHSWESLPTPVLLEFSYEYDNLGRRISFTHDQDGTSKDRFDAFQYNDRNELTNTQRFAGVDTSDTSTPWSNHQFSYDYDSIGNRRTATLPGAVNVAYSTDELNQYTSIRNPDIQCVINETQKLVGSDTAAGDSLGICAALDGERLLLAAPFDDDNVADSGSAYFFTTDSHGTWGSEEKVVASDPLSNARFSWSVDIDGDWAIVGAHKAQNSLGVDSGAVYVFEQSGGSWTFHQKLSVSTGASNDFFGLASAIDGDTIVVGARGENGEIGAAYVYRHNPQLTTDEWEFEGKLTATGGATGDTFGVEVAIQGDTIVVGASRHDHAGVYNTGAAYVFNRSGTTWTQHSKLTASDYSYGDYFGQDADIDGDRIVVGAYLREGAQAGEGAVYMFERDAGTGVWSESQKLTASDATLQDQFGISVDIEGDRLVVGAHREDLGAVDGGSGYVFTYDSVAGSWNEVARLLASDIGADDAFSVFKIGMSGDRALFGARYHDAAGADAGAAYVFDVADTNLNAIPDPCETLPTYDADGNLTRDGAFAYTWNAENRLVQVQPLAVGFGDKRVLFTYDFLGRRVEREVQEYQQLGQVAIWASVEQTRYVYDGWNVVLELDGLSGNAVSKSYTWGLDLSGSLQGAGGVGGLLACHDHRATATTSDDATYLYCYDGNGNVRALLDSKNGDLLGLYDYDPYGNLLSKTGDEADENLHRFSTKPWDDVARLYYYVYRHYSPELGRWVSRDPIGESDGPSTFEFVANSPASYVDALGLWKIYVPYVFQGIHEAMTFGASNGLSCRGEINELCYRDLQRGLNEGVRYPDVPQGPVAVGFVESFTRIVNRNFLTYRSHRGDLQWWHAMWFDEDTAGELRDKITGRAIGHAIDVLSLQDDYDPSGCFQMGFLLGQTLHTIQDSWSRSHVERDEFGNIVRFLSYNKQNSSAHGEADKDIGSHEFNKAIALSKEYLELALCNNCNENSLWEKLQLAYKIKRFIEERALRFRDGKAPELGGHGGFDKKP